jgi:glycosyltransferase involved in cell wall biosynthesis
MSKARVSLVVPCFNDGTYVEEMVDQLDEPFPIDIIVVDDNSNDADSLAATDRLSHVENVRVLKRVNNAGPAAACRLGAQVAVAPYVFFLGADDLVVPHTLSLLAEELDNHPECGFAYGDFITFGERVQYMPAMDWDAWLMTQGNYCSAMLLIRRELYQAIGGHPTRSAFEDWDLTLALVNAGATGIHLPQPAFFYRTHPASRGRRYESGSVGYGAEYRRLQSYYPELFARLPRLAETSRLSGLQRAMYTGILKLRCHLPAAVIDPLLRQGSRLFLKAPAGRVYAETVPGSRARDAVSH